MNNTVTPKLSVLLVTYDHEKYIRQALDSVIMQRTDFDFEIVVADDYSQDATVAIVQEYQADHHNIRVLQSEKNVGITRNYQRGFAACRGEYIAVLEGDDFWISPNKLNLLTTFLDQHQECAFCFHRFIRHDEPSNRFRIHPPFEIEKEHALFSAAQLARDNLVGNFSACVYRREVIDGVDPSLFEMKVYDWMFNITVAQKGAIGYLPTIMSIYRAHGAGAWSGKTPNESRPELLELIDTYNKYLKFQFDAEFLAYKSDLLADTIKPKVSVLLITYNHEKYIRQALESVLMQKTDFGVEIVVADDYSNDSTLPIVQEYLPGSPHLRLLQSTEKLGITRNYQRGFEACRGEYVAILEGDDYWISPNKLKLVSAFLDGRPDCAFCFHRLIRHDEVSEHTLVHPSFGEKKTETVVFKASQLARENFIGNFSTCTYRREVIANLDPALWKLKVREWPFNIVVAQHGTIGYVPEIMSVYRAHSRGIWSRRTKEERKSEILELIDTYNKFLDYNLDSEFRAFKRGWGLQRAGLAGAERPVFPRLRSWMEPFIPPVLLTLARDIYHRAGRKG